MTYSQYSLKWFEGLPRMLAASVCAAESWVIGPLISQQWIPAYQDTPKAHNIDVVNSGNGPFFGCSLFTRIPCQRLLVTKMHFVIWMVKEHSQVCQKWPVVMEVHWGLFDIWLIDKWNFPAHDTSASAKCKSVWKPCANLPDTLIAGARASKYFKMLPAPPGALQSTPRCCESILLCFWKHLQLWSCIQSAIGFDNQESQILELLKSLSFESSWDLCARPAGDFVPHSHSNDTSGYTIARHFVYQIRLW